MEIKDKSDYMLSTFDNPFNPFDDFETWWKQDLLLEHDCCGILAKEAAISENFGDERNDEEIDAAVERIISQNPTLFRKVYRENFK